MGSTVPNIAVLGSGISGAVCASMLARNGLAVTIFESARGPGGRMSQRREITEDGKELLFDHGAPYFSATNTEVLSLVNNWKVRGVVAEWNETFGTFDFVTKQFDQSEKEKLSKKFVGVTGMNSICKALCQEPGIKSMFGIGVGRLEWLDEKGSWLLTGVDGQFLGHFSGVVASDKNIVSQRFSNVTGKLPPLDLSLVPELAMKLKEIPVRSCFALMLAFEEPLSAIPLKGFSFQNSEVLSRAFCNSSKPNRSTTSEQWVLHSTDQYAQTVIAQTGLQKLSSAALSKVADELFQEFEKTGLNIPRAIFMKAHRWGSAFPAASVAREDKCLWDENKRLAICGDFCVSPSVEGAILSGLAAASKFINTLACSL